MLFIPAGRDNGIQYDSMAYQSDGALYATGPSMHIWRREHVHLHVRGAYPVETMLNHEASRHQLCRDVQYEASLGQE